LIALATCNSPRNGHQVLPWGGREARLGTNPIAYAVPTGGDPIVADFSTSVAPEGKIRFRRNEGQPTPDGWILDAEGRPTNDPNQFYGPPRGGILPLGGAAGHKGFALSLLVEILGGALAGVRLHDPIVYSNGVCFVVIDPSAFCPLAEFRRLMDETVAYIKSSAPAPGFAEVLVPGELEFRTLRRREREGIPVDPQTLEALKKHGQRLGVDAEAPLEPKDIP
ncbi:MAG TPA: Ldh family oxidoreductase, partial [Pirellulales bacterium]|nr:Ldh family oxidoreductase [Pirellulales bacterium]